MRHAIWYAFLLTQAIRFAIISLVVEERRVVYRRARGKPGQSNHPVGGFKHRIYTAFSHQPDRLREGTNLQCEGALCTY